MKVRIGALTVLAIAALRLFSGCSSGDHSSSGSGGAPGTGGALGTGGAGIADAGPDGRDGGGDGSHTDAAVDAPPATLTQIWTTILSDVTTATAPACVGCHDGSDRSIPDYTSIATTYASWVGVASTSCPGSIRVTAGNAETSVLVNKLRSKPVLGLGVTACGGDPMPIGNRSITLDQLHLIENWINAGALNN
jgi:hypothetical protein